MAAPIDADWSSTVITDDSLNKTTYGQGSSNPSTWPVDRLFWRTDTNKLYKNTGTSGTPVWSLVGADVLNTQYYGDGSDGENLTLSGVLDESKNYTNCTISGAVTSNNCSIVIKCTGTLTINSSVTPAYATNGRQTAGTGGAGGRPDAPTVGTTGFTGSPSCLSGGGGGNGSDGSTGQNGSTNPVNGATGGAGGHGMFGNSTPNVAQADGKLAASTLPFGYGGGGGSGGGGGGGGYNSGNSASYGGDGGAGGAGGDGGGSVILVADTIVFGGSGSINVSGEAGTGGSAGVGGTGSGHGDGGSGGTGGGGGGGVAIVVYKTSLTNGGSGKYSVGAGSGGTEAQSGFFKELQIT